MNNSFLFDTLAYSSPVPSHLSAQRVHSPMDPIRDFMESLADCLRADSWLTASVSLENGDRLPRNVLASFPESAEQQNTSSVLSDYTELFCDALLAETVERASWERNHLERSRYFTTYEVLEEPTHTLLAYHATAEGMLRGAAFFSSSPFSSENLHAFRVLFDSVAVSEGKKGILIRG